MVKCYNKFCVYQKNDRCILDAIEIIFGGVCDSCIYFNIDEKEMDELKIKTLINLGEY